MNEITDKLLISISCLVLYLFNIDIGFAVIPAILSIMLTSLFMYYEDPRLNLAGSLLFLLLCAFIPQYIIFAPLILYDIFHTKYQYAALIVPLLFLAGTRQYTLQTFAFTMIVLSAAYLLKIKTDRLKIMQAEYNELRDSSSSFSQLLTEKNRSILKNQDYEINLATLNERGRISKEIHDNIGHLLSRALLQVGALLTITKEDPVKEGLTSLKESLSSGMDDIRSSIHKMYDDSIDLYTQIELLTKDFTFCSITSSYDIKTAPSLAVKYSLIAIIKEALANIMKHSIATKAGITLREHPAMYQLIIQDNGKIDEQKKKKLLQDIGKYDNPEGMGLRNISDRVKGFDGNININLEDGFKLFITIPKKK